VSKKRLLDRVEIPKPCLADWERMVGTQQIRFCEECNKHVYNLSDMSRREAEALIASAPRGRLCARLTRDAAGATITADDQPGVHLIWRRPSPLANAVVSAMLTMTTPAVAGVGQVTNQQSSMASVIETPEAKPDWQGPATTLSGSVMDSTGAAIEGALLKLINEDTGDAQTVTSSNDGVFRLFVPAGGLFTLNVQGPGLDEFEANGLNLGVGQDKHLVITMIRTPTFTILGGAMRIPMRGLLDLYSQSDRIVLARAVRSVKIQSIGQSFLVRTSLTVSSTLKGEPESLVNVYDSYDGSQGPFSPDETLLVFLRHRETIGDKKTDGGYELVDFLRAVKHLSSSDLESYVQRINELGRLSPETKSHQEEVVEWLVRCAEDPATRWEGAHSLASSAATLQASLRQDDSEEEANAPEEAEEQESDESVEADATEQAALDAHELYDNAAYAALLTADQKERLMKTLLSTKTITEGNAELVEAVKDFHDPRLLPFLVSQLRRAQDNPPEYTTSVAQVVAELLHDKRIDALAESYAELRYGDDENATEEAAAAKRSSRLREFLQKVNRIMGARNLKSEKR